jgi:tetratricopeptide (TPR) repeat protein
MNGNKIKKQINTETKLEETKPKVYKFKDVWKFLKSNFIIFFILADLIFLIYAPLIKGQFLNLDDQNGIVLNKLFYSISASLKALDAQAIAIAIVVRLFGMNSTALHIFSLLLHIACTILTLVLAYLLFGKKVSIITAFLFATQSVNSEAVGWLTGSGYLIRTIVILLILIFYVMFRRSKNIWYLIISTLIYLASQIFIKSQGWMFITPFLLAIVDQFLIEKKIEFKNIKYYIPYILISLVFAAILVPTLFKERVSGLNTMYYVNTDTATPLINRIPYTIYMAYELIAFPLVLTIYHEGEIISGAYYSFMVAVTVALVFGIAYLWKKDRIIAGLLLTIPLSILPSFSPVIIAWTAAERYLYMGAAFFSMAVAILILRIEEKKRWKKFALYATITLCLLYSVRTFTRSFDLNNSKSLWLASKKVSPYSYRVYNNLGDVYANEGSYDLAIEAFKRSWALKPDYADAVHNIGYIYLQRGDIARAKKYFQLSIDMNPRLFQSWYKMGRILIAEKNYQQAEIYMSKALELQPNDATVQQSMAEINLLKSTVPQVVSSPTNPPATK